MGAGRGVRGGSWEGTDRRAGPKTRSRLCKLSSPQPVCQARLFALVASLTPGRDVRLIQHKACRQGLHECGRRKHSVNETAQGSMSQPVFAPWQPGPVLWQLLHRVLPPAALPHPPVRLMNSRRNREPTEVAMVSSRHTGKGGGGMGKGGRQARRGSSDAGLAAACSVDQLQVWPSPSARPSLCAKPSLSARLSPAAMSWKRDTLQMLMRKSWNLRGRDGGKLLGGCRAGRAGVVHRWKASPLLPPRPRCQGPPQPPHQNIRKRTVGEKPTIQYTCRCGAVVVIRGLAGQHWDGLPASPPPALPPQQPVQSTTSRTLQQQLQPGPHHHCPDGRLQEAVGDAGHKGGNGKAPACKRAGGEATLEEGGISQGARLASVPAGRMTGPGRHGGGGGGGGARLMAAGVRRDAQHTAVRSRRCLATHQGRTACGAASRRPCREGGGEGQLHS